jgi:hypothetical protein
MTEVVVFLVSHGHETTQRRPGKATDVALR